MKMQKRWFNHQQFISRRHHIECLSANNTQSEFYDMLSSLPVYEFFAGKHLNFLQHIIHPLKISSKFYAHLQFIYGLPTLLSREQKFFSENKSILYSHYEKKNLMMLINNFSTDRQTIQTVKTLFVSPINNVQTANQKKPLNFSITERALFVAKTQLTEHLRTFKSSSHQSPIRLIVPGVIKHLSANVQEPWSSTYWSSTYWSST